uniref:Esterase-like protein 1 n=1 Tax=Lonomia obliqua TaxID=304329 RepID=Q5MGH9_LONON|nr:esterase-like protein 1 [Lonomia obliqua]
MWYIVVSSNPNPQSDTPELSHLSWPAMKPNARKYLRIGKDFSIHENLFEERFRVWEELYPLPQ